MFTKGTIALATVFAVAILAVMLSLTPGVASVEVPQSPAPPHPCAGANIYCGDVPPGGGEDLPVLVFVHGFGGLAQDWWSETEHYGVNDMYVTAYNAGYRTAFVTLNEDGGRFPVRTIWANGATLAGQIEDIADHYGVDTVDIVAHSKGGVDAQAAVVYYGAAPYVRNIFTLSSPHWGTEIADLAFETKIGSLLAALVGLRGPGTYTTTIDYMSNFRLLTDGRTEDDDINYYWGAGTDHGPKRSPLQLTGWYLQKVSGDNDGLVTVTSAELPGDNSSELFVDENLNHENICIGSYVFEYIDTIASAP